MKTKKKKKLLSSIGLGILLVHNNVKIEQDKLNRAVNLLSKEFDGDNAKVLEFIEKEYNEMLNKVLGDDSIENK